MDEVLNLGGSIELAGFSSLDGGSMIILKKIVGNYAKKMSERSDKFEKLSLVMKPVHEREHSELYEIYGKLIDNGKLISSKSADRNLFVAVDGALKKIESEITG